MVQSSTGQRASKLEKEIASKRDFRQHTISFVMMIFLTILSFIAIASDAVSDKLAILFIVVLACVQVFFQLIIWMHMGQKGHAFPKVLLGFGGIIALVTVISLMTLIHGF